MSARMDLLGFLMWRGGLYLELSWCDGSMLSKVERFGVAKYLGLGAELMGDVMEWKVDELLFLQEQLQLSYISRPL
jgi:hypothetical protein